MVSPTFDVSGLEEVTSYVISVRAETLKGFGNTTYGNVTTGPQSGSPPQPKALSVDLTEAAVHLHWINGVAKSSPITGYLVQGKRDDGTAWETIEVLQAGRVEQHEISYLNVAPSTCKIPLVLS